MQTAAPEDGCERNRDQLLGRGSCGAELLLLLLDEPGLGPGCGVAVNQSLGRCAVEPFDGGAEVGFQNLGIRCRLRQCDSHLLDGGTQSRGRRAVPQATRDVLKERYARGELTKDDYDGMRRDILV